MNKVNNILEMLTGQKMQSSQQTPAELPKYNDLNNVEVLEAALKIAKQNQKKKEKIPVPESPKNISEVDVLKARLKEAEAKQQPIQPTIPETYGDNNVYKKISSRVCGVEVLKWLNLAKIFSLGSVIGIIALLVTNFFGLMVQMIVGLFMIIPTVVYLAMVNKEIVRLKRNYGL